jgi:hypothetical protein
MTRDVVAPRDLDVEEEPKHRLRDQTGDPIDEIRFPANGQQIGWDPCHRTPRIWRTITVPRMNQIAAVASTTR